MREMKIDASPENLVLDRGDAIIVIRPCEKCGDGRACSAFRVEIHHDVGGSPAGLLASAIAAKIVSDEEWTIEIVREYINDNPDEAINHYPALGQRH